MHKTSPRPEWEPDHPSDLARQLTGYRLTTAEILYRMPDHPSLVQSFVWQCYDQAPDYPALRRFLAFWQRDIEGELVGVTVGSRALIDTARYRHLDGLFTLH